VIDNPDMKQYTERSTIGPFSIETNLADILKQDREH